MQTQCRWGFCNKEWDHATLRHAKKPGSLPALAHSAMRWVDPTVQHHESEKVRSEAEMRKRVRGEWEVRVSQACLTETVIALQTKGRVSGRLKHAHVKSFLRWCTVEAGRCVGVRGHGCLFNPGGTMQRSKPTLHHFLKASPPAGRLLLPPCTCPIGSPEGAKHRATHKNSTCIEKIWRYVTLTRHEGCWFAK